MKTFKMIDPNLIRLYRYFMPYKWRLGFACVFLMGSASMSSITATLLGKMADLGFYQQESWMIYAAPVALIAVTVGFAFCTVMSAYLMAQGTIVCEGDSNFLVNDPKAREVYLGPQFTM